MPAEGVAALSFTAPCAQDGVGSNTELVNVVYLDNSSLELYHSLLDKRPNAVTYRLRRALLSAPSPSGAHSTTHRC